MLFKMIRERTPSLLLLIMFIQPQQGTAETSPIEYQNTFKQSN